MRGWGIVVQNGVPFLLALACLLFGGCSPKADMTLIETDAHGYLCQKCSGKFYTGAKEFLEGKCPKCGQEALTDVAGYWCEKDQHMTIRSEVLASAASVICQKCYAPLRGKMVSPKEKDLIAWGATKTEPPR